MSNPLKLTTALFALVFLVTGGWALVAPEPFYETVASYPPYNEHFIHDLGAFQLGIAGALVLGAAGAGGLAVALGGHAVAAVGHALAHVMDAGAGGRDSDPVSLSIYAVAAVTSAVIALRRRDG